MNILILGRSPSKLNDYPNVPFLGAPCYPRLKSWIKQLRTPEREFYVDNCTHKMNARFSKRDIELYAKSLQLYYGDIQKIIALGNDAAQVCKAAKMTYFKLPHPSGLNRQINDSKNIEKLLKECDRWLSLK